MKIILFFLIIFTSVNVSAQMNDESRAERFINNFYSKPGHVNNQVLIVAEYAASQMNSYNLTSDTKLVPTHNIELYYGFIRIDKETGNKDLFKHQSEYAFLGNISTDFKTFDVDTEGLKSDSWRFGFGLNDGFGFLSSDDEPILFLNHSTAISFLRADFEGSPINSNDAVYIENFDREYKFGQIYSGGLRYKIGSIFHLNAQYEISQYYGKFEFLPWFGMWLTDNVLQRWIDYFERDLIEVLGTNYPWVKFVYKNFISFLSYQLRKHEMYFPFGSDAPLYFDAYKIGLTLVI
ncbi:MAG: hypothetical protein WC313_02405 [Candidatus Kapaibacterium sp.]|nr:hypothetical protein [Candidatus Kapabacteria bacterium]